MMPSISFPEVAALSALLLTSAAPDRFPRADHYGAFIVGLIVIATAIRVAYEAAMHLMDTMPDDDAMDDIRVAAASVPECVGVEKCFARKTGLKYHVDLHLEVDPEITVRARTILRSGAGASLRESALGRGRAGSRGARAER